MFRHAGGDVDRDNRRGSEQHGAFCAQVGDDRCERRFQVGGVARTIFNRLDKGVQRFIQRCTAGVPFACKMFGCGVVRCSHEVVAFTQGVPFQMQAQEARCFRPFGKNLHDGLNSTLLAGALQGALNVLMATGGEKSKNGCGGERLKCDARQGGNQLAQGVQRKRGGRCCKRKPGKGFRGMQNVMHARQKSVGIGHDVGCFYFWQNVHGIPSRIKLVCRGVVCNRGKGGSIGKRGDYINQNLCKIAISYLFLFILTKLFHAR